MGILIADIVQVDTIKNEAGSVTTKGVLQVASATKLDTFTTTSTSNVDITGMTVATLTPRDTNSKFLIFGGVEWANSASGHVNFIQIVRVISGGATTDIAINTDGGTSAHATACGLHQINYELTGSPFSFLDSPATASDVTYKLQGRAGGNTMVVNRRGDGVDQGGVSTITVMEIQG